MQISVKLFSSLMEYLPADANGNKVALQFPDYSCSAAAVIAKLRIPPQAIQVVMINGEFQPVEKRDLSLSEGDSVSIWPAIQGG